MKSYHFLFLLLFAACTNNTKGPSSDSVHSTSATTPFTSLGLQAGCYKMITGPDTNILTISISDTIVSGSLLQIWSKSPLRKELQVTGIVRDSLLFAHIPMADGSPVSYQFLIRNDSLLPAEWVVMPGPGQDGLAEYNEKNAYTRVKCK